MTTAPAKRKKPITDTHRELFLKSGNLCAFPGCGQLMMNKEGKFIGQICHIEAAEKGGQRFNPAMTDDERRAASNLMLMCYPHHVATNDVAKYTVERLKKMKADHEGRFSDPQRAILEAMQDRTKAVQPKPARNVKRLSKHLGWVNSDEELRGTADLLNRYVDKRFRMAPLGVRHFLGAISTRAHEAQHTRAVYYSEHHEVRIATSDLQGVFGLDWDTVVAMARQLENYHLGDADQIEDDTSSQPAIRIAAADGWNLWKDLASFCEKEGVEMTVFSDELDFSRLDE